MFNPPSPPRYVDYRRHVDELVTAGIGAADSGLAVSGFLKKEGRTLSIGREPEVEPIDLDQGRVFLVASGKAAVPMARAALRVLGDDLEAGIIITKDIGQGEVGVAREDEFAGRPVKIIAAGHPVPDERGIDGTKAVVEMLSAARREDVVLCLISGGTSALLTQPLMPLEDWRKLVELLLKSGCTINEFNIVRRSVDRIKGGGLARAVSPATCYGLILSDVVGNPLNMIGSGPTVPDEDLVVSACKCWVDMTLPGNWSVRSGGGWRWPQPGSLFAQSAPTVSEEFYCWRCAWCGDCGFGCGDSPGIRGSGFDDPSGWTGAGDRPSDSRYWP